MQIDSLRSFGFYLRIIGLFTFGFSYVVARHYVYARNVMNVTHQ